MAPRKVSPKSTKLAKPVNGKLYWVQLVGHKSQWHIALHDNGLWYVPGDRMPWGAVKKYMSGPEIPEAI